MPSLIEISGAGMVGLTLARCLKNKGMAAIFFEENPSAAHHNRGISLQLRTWTAFLKILQIDEKTFVKRVTVDGMINRQWFVHSSDKGRNRDKKDGVDSLRAHRGKLESLLGEEVDVRRGHVLQDISSQGSEHNLKIKISEKVESAFIVDASEVHSGFRKSLLLDS
jgi:2-polyprenyl-6-methoxyphenol hydroxylase-like FAD-dependent oxidoreductase